MQTLAISRLLLALILGIITKVSALDIPYFAGINLLLGTTLITLYYSPFPIKIKFLLRHSFDLGAFFIFFFLGYALATTQPTPTILNLPKEGVAHVHLLSEEQHSSKWKTFLVSIEQLYSEHGTQTFDSPPPKALLYIPIDSMHPDLTPGSQVITPLRITPIKASLNPYADNYQKYLAQRAIHYRLFLTQNLGNIIQAPTTGSIPRLRDEIRNKVFTSVNKILPKQHTLLICSLLLGKQKQLSPSLRASFNQSGLAHVLAISGLHTGILAGLILCLLYPFVFLRLNALRYILCILALWGYAYLCFFPTSMVRACAMISLMLFTKILSNHYHSQQALLLTALGSLCYHPFLLYEVSFQLSFLAVGSILLYYKRIQQSLSITHRHPLLYRFASLISISVSANILTLPLSIYYFHHLPIWFLISNLILIPTLPFLIGSSLYLALAQGTCFAAASLVKGYSWMVDTIITCVEKLAQLPQLPRIDLNLYQVGLIYGIIFILSHEHFHRPVRNFYFKLSTISILTLLIFYFQEKMPERELIIFNQASKQAIHLRLQNQLLVFGLNPNQILDTLPSWAEAGYCEQYNVKEIITDSASLHPYGLYRSGFYDIQGKHFFLAQKSPTLTDSIFNPIQVDYLLISKQTDCTLETLKKCIHWEELIILPDTPPWTRNTILQEASKYKEPLYDIQSQGALRIIL